MSKTAARNLIAAAIAATAIPAFAQNVVLYGIADIGVAVQNFNDDTLTQVRENRTARWGIRGAEKLGGGLEALFRLEGEIDMSTGTTGDNPLFYRQAWLGLRGAWGTGRLGQTKDLFDDLSEEIDPFRNDGIFGDFSKRAWRVGVVKSRVSNSFTYESPKLYGLQVNGQYSMDETIQTGNPGWSVSTIYNWKDLGVYAAYDRPTITNNDPQSWAWFIGASYQFGPVRASGSYNHGNLNNGTSKSSDTELDAYTVGLAWNVGPGVAKIAYSTMESSAGNVNASVRDVSAYGIGYDWVLSRRTTLYFIGMLETDGQYNSATKKFITGDTKGIQIGITHLW